MFRLVHSLPNKSEMSLHKYEDGEYKMIANNLYFLLSAR